MSHTIRRNCKTNLITGKSTKKCIKIIDTCNVLAKNLNEYTANLHLKTESDLNKKFEVDFQFGIYRKFSKLYLTVTYLKSCAESISIIFLHHRGETIQGEDRNPTNSMIITFPLRSDTSDHTTTFSLGITHVNP